MGFLTPILIRNDCLSDILEHPEQLTDGILDAANHREEITIPIGNHANPIESLGTAHADTSRVVLIHGNTWVDLSREIYNPTNENFTFTGYLKRCLKKAQSDITSLKKKLKEREALLRGSFPS